MFTDEVIQYGAAGQRTHSDCRYPNRCWLVLFLQLFAFLRIQMTQCSFAVLAFSLMSVLMSSYADAFTLRRVSSHHGRIRSTLLMVDEDDETVETVIAATNVLGTALLPCCSTDVRGSGVGTGFYMTAGNTASHIHAATAVPFTGTAGVATTTPTLCPLRI